MTWGFALLYVACGVLLAFNFERVGASWFSGPDRWFDSPLLPIWVAVVLYALSALRGRRPVWQESLLGLGVTLPPYALALYRATNNLSSLMFTVVLLLAVSGALLNPACSWLVGRRRGVV
jgi:hypothetical protein